MKTLVKQVRMAGAPLSAIPRQWNISRIISMIACFLSLIIVVTDVASGGAQSEASAGSAITDRNSPYSYPIHSPFDDIPLSNAGRNVVRGISRPDRDFGWARYATMRSINSGSAMSILALDRLVSTYVARDGQLSPDLAREVISRAIDDYKDETRLERPAPSHPLVVDVVDLYPPAMGATILLDRLTDPNPEAVIREQMNNIDSNTRLIDRRETVFRMIQVIGESNPALGPVIVQFTESPQVDQQTPLLPPGSFGKTQADLANRDEAFGAIVRSTENVVDAKDDGAAEKVVEEINKFRDKAANDGLSETQGLASSVNDGNGIFKIDFGNAGKPKDDETIREEKIRRVESDVNEARAGIYLVSSLSSFIKDPVIRKEIGGVCQGASFMVTISENVALCRLGEISSLAMSANIVGAAASLFSFFNHGPDEMALVLQELRNVQSEIRSLETEMQRNFAEIDEKLNSLFQEVSQGLDTLIAGQVRIEDKLDRLQIELSDMDARLQRIEIDLPLYFQSLQNDMAEEQVLFVLESPERHASFQISWSQFVKGTDYFLSWGALDGARSPLVSGTLGRGTRLEDVYAGLNSPLAKVITFAHPADGSISPVVPDALKPTIDDDMNYIAEVMRANFPEFRDTDMRPHGRTLVNVGRWLSGSEWYLALCRTWPQYAKNVQPENTRDFISAGQDLKAFLSQTRGQRIMSLLVDRFFFENYVLLKAMGDRENQYLESKKLVGTDLWSKKYPQPVSYSIRRDKVDVLLDSPATSDAAANRQKIGQIAVPDGFWNKMPQRFAFCEAIGAGNVDIQIIFSWKPGQQIIGRPQSPRYHPSIMFAATWKPEKVAAVIGSVDSPDEFDPNNLPDPMSYLSDNFTSGQKLAQKLLANVEVDAPLYGKSDADYVQQILDENVPQAMKARRQEIYDDLSKALSKELKPNVDRVLGTSALIKAFLLLGYRDLIINDVLVYALVYGKTQLPDLEFFSEFGNNLGRDGARSSDDYIFCLQRQMGTGVKDFWTFNKQMNAELLGGPKQPATDTSTAHFALTDTYFKLDRSLMLHVLRDVARNGADAVDTPIDQRLIELSSELRRQQLPRGN
ncbi:MAG: hypothetical protein M3O30_16185 [Planctomycetota bacterium]|nr:hypothetical protein [Planctomycetota bacterium]